MVIMSVLVLRNLDQDVSDLFRKEIFSSDHQVRKRLYTILFTFPPDRFCLIGNLILIMVDVTVFFFVF